MKEGVVKKHITTKSHNSKNSKISTAIKTLLQEKKKLIEKNIKKLNYSKKKTTTLNRYQLYMQKKLKLAMSY